MKKFMIIFITCFMLSGCSLLPRITFDTPGTVPQATQKSKAKEICQGKAEWNEIGQIKSCSKGYFNYASGYEKIERKMTIIERVKSFFNTILGWGIPGLIVICFLFPGAFTLIGVILGRFIKGSVGIVKKTLTQVSTAIQKVKDKNPDLISALEASTDEDVKKFITEFKQKNGIK